jgi:3-isopropylmalate/(R)-2-methylmalate dehydratase large subunit
MTIMGLTITEKILAAHSDADQVKPGQIIRVRVDLALANDITAPLAIEQFEAVGAGKVFDPDRIALVLDHFSPAKDIKSAEQCKLVRQFAKKHAIRHFYEGGAAGVEHALLPEQGLVLPGELILGADSHTCTYGALGAFATGVGSTDLAAALITGETWLKVPASIKFVLKGKRRPWVEGKDLILRIIGDIGVDGARYQAMEFCGDGVADLPMSGRFTMTNMAIEAGAKNGIFAADKVSREYVSGRAERPFTAYESDADAEYVEVREYDLSAIEPQVALPHLPENSIPVSEVGRVSLDQVIIGSCTNGWIEDMRAAAEILKGRKVASDVRLIIIPATPTIYRQCMTEGLTDIFLDAGAVVSPPTCGPCLGGYMGVLAKGERALATTNRNFVGRMGHPESEVYLANPYLAAASAVLGRIGGPEEL